jgi:hypothetical protein
LALSWLLEPVVFGGISDDCALVEGADGASTDPGGEIGEMGQSSNEINAGVSSVGDTVSMAASRRFFSAGGGRLCLSLLSLHPSNSDILVHTARCLRAALGNKQAAAAAAALDSTLFGKVVTVFFLYIFLNEYIWCASEFM